jgi:hypothetical protein
MELFPVRNVMGFSEILWALRQWRKKRGSGRWSLIAGVVEGYELLLANNGGWLVVLYSYGFQGGCFSGEWRKWVFVQARSYEGPAATVTERLPIGTKIGVRVDPEHPANSVAEL